MGTRARQLRELTERTIRATRLSDGERARLTAEARYEGNPQHKRNPGDFKLSPPASPRRDKVLCDEAGVFKAEIAKDLLRRAIERGLVSEGSAGNGMPKQLWLYHDGRVFEAMYGSNGAYHGYPIRKSDPFFDEVLARWAGAA